MLQPKVLVLPGHIQAIYVQNILKVLSLILTKKEEENDHAGVVEVRRKPNLY